MIVQSKEFRHSFQHDAEGLVIRIPALRNYLALAFLLFWLCGWAVGEVVAIAWLLAGAKSPNAWPLTAFLSVWLCGWTWGGLNAIHVCLWQWKGCEIVKATSAHLSIRRDVFGFGRTREYQVSDIRDLREEPCHRRNGIEVQWLAFDYHAKTIHFGSGIDEEAAQHILQLIGSRVPQLAVANEE